jgi:urease accessory protein
MPTESSDKPSLAQLRLLQLVSPALPIGAFTYSQGLEWAVEAGWVTDEASLSDWLTGLAEDGLRYVDLPILARQYRAIVDQDWSALSHWSHALLACRETRELREEENNRGRALVSLLADLGLIDDEIDRRPFTLCQAAGFALAAVRWEIPLDQATLGYAWGWLENQVTAGVKLIPLGQTAGQRITADLARHLPLIVTQAFDVGDEEIGASAPALAIASSRHETQYTRLFRS